MLGIFQLLVWYLLFSVSWFGWLPSRFGILRSFFLWIVLPALSPPLPYSRLGQVSFLCALPVLTFTISYLFLQVRLLQGAVAELYLGLKRLRRDICEGECFSSLGMFQQGSILSEDSREESPLASFIFLWVQAFLGWGCITPSLLLQSHGFLLWVFLCMSILCACHYI